MNTSIRTMEQQVKTCKGEGEHSGEGAEFEGKRSPDDVIKFPDSLLTGPELDRNSLIFIQALMLGSLAHSEP